MRNNAIELKSLQGQWISALRREYLSNIYFFAPFIRRFNLFNLLAN